MKIAIVSDTHDNLANLKKAISFIEKEKIKVLIHCGDVSTVDTLKEILESFSGKLYLALGNMDERKLNSSLSFPRAKIFDNFGKIKINTKKIAFTHSPTLAQKLVKEQKYDLIFYGHTHKPWEEKIGKTKLINPGNLAGLIFKATFAIYDTKSDELKLNLV